MTNTLPHGSTGAPPPAQYSGPNAGMAPRRSSYASVAAGTATASTQSQPPTRSGAFSHLLNPNPSYSTGSQAQESESRPGNPQQISEGIASATGVNTIPSSWGKVGSTYSPIYSEKYSVEGRYGYNMVKDTSGFFIPTYLRNSRYMEKLEAAHKAKIIAQREAASAYASNPGSLSTSSSSVSLHRMAPSHRGMTFEIIEHAPSIDVEDPLPSLPSKWSQVDKYGVLEIAADGLDVRYASNLKSSDHEAAAARADAAMPLQCGIYYYEATVISKGKEGNIGIGFSGPKASLERVPGWETDSWAYHGDDGKSYGSTTNKNYGPTFSSGDVIGCGVNFWSGCAFFTKNGVYQGNAFRDLPKAQFFPSVGMKRPGAQLRVNFGQAPFLFDIDDMMAKESLKVRDEINAVDVASLHPPLNEDSLIKELVAQFLAHDGYVESAKAFAGEVRAEANALRNGTGTVLSGFEIDGDLDAVNRQQIRAAILDGDIDKALKRIHAYYPHVLRDNHQINFRLRCRKFLEMMRQCAELRKAANDRRPKSTTGHSNDIFEQAMELDDPTSNGDEWDKMDTEEIDNGLKYEDKINDMIRYGTDLKFEFQDETNKEVMDLLQGIFAMFCYEDPWKSPTAHLLEQSGRVVVAEEINSAILVSLGKSSSAAIERLCQQTEVLISDISEQGGPGAFVNVRNDFLR